MALARFQATITDESGNVVPGAMVEVRREDNLPALALLKSDRAGSVPLANPFAADADGYAAFHAPGGAYRIRAYVGTSFERIWRYVPIGLAAETDFTVVAPRGAWGALEEYAQGDLVTHIDGDGNVLFFISKNSGNVGNEPPDSAVDDAFWMYGGEAESAAAVEAAKDAALAAIATDSGEALSDISAASAAAAALAADALTAIGTLSDEALDDITAEAANALGAIDASEDTAVDAVEAAAAAALAGMSGKLPKDGSENLAVLRLPEGTAPGTPASGVVAVYAKTDGKVYKKDDAGTETEIGSGGGSGIQPQAYGAVGDGVTNDKVAMKSWFAAGGSTPLHLPAGTWRMSMNDAEAIATLPAKTRVVGDGRDVSILEIIINPANVTFHELFGLVNGNIAFQDMTIKVVTSGSATNYVAWFRHNGSHVAFRRVKFQGNVTFVGTTASALSYIFNQGGSGTSDNFTLEDCTFENHNYIFLKANSSTTVERNWKIRGNEFRRSGSGGVNLNSPNGSFEDVWIEDNLFEDLYHGTTNRLPVALASVRNVYIRGNRFKGRIDQDCIHIEEASGNVFVTENIIECEGLDPSANNNNGIWIGENNIAGSVSVPNNILVAHNIIKHTASTVKKGSGIYLKYDGTADEPVSRIHIHDNIIDNFAQGIQTGEGIGDDRNIHDNTISNCGIGLYLYRPSPNCKNNVIEDCTIGLKSVAGGLWGKQHFKGTFTTFVDAATAGGQALAGWSRTLKSQSHVASGNQNYDLFPRGDRAEGSLRFYAQRAESNLDWGTVQVAVKWDGTTFTATNGIKGAGGGALDIPAPGAADNAAILAARLFLGSAQTNINIQAEFEGLQQFS